MKKLLLTAALSASVLAAQSANALMVNSAGHYPLKGTTVAAESQLAGTVLVDELQEISFKGDKTDISFNVQNRVVKAVDGTIDFYWRIRDVKGTGSIETLRIGDFGAVFGNNVNYRIDGLGNRAPDFVKVFDNDSLNYVFHNGIQAGDSSKFLMIDTDTTYYAKTAAYDFTFIGESSITGLYSTYAPAEVPVPAAVWLFGSALLGLAGVGRKK